MASTATNLTLGVTAACRPLKQSQADLPAPSERDGTGGGDRTRVCTDEHRCYFEVRGGAGKGGDRYRGGVGEFGLTVSKKKTETLPICVKKQRGSTSRRLSSDTWVTLLTKMAT